MDGKYIQIINKNIFKNNDKFMFFIITLKKLSCAPLVLRFSIAFQYNRYNNSLQSLYLHFHFVFLLIFLPFVLSSFIQTIIFLGTLPFASSVLISCTHCLYSTNEEMFRKRKRIVFLLVMQNTVTEICNGCLKKKQLATMLSLHFNNG